MIDLKSIPLNDEKTWNLLCSGKTQGIWQLETSLGKKYTRELRPRSINELATLNALLRPGSLHSRIGNKTIIQKYIDRKFKKEPIEKLEPELADILKETLGLLVFQESQIEIAHRLAGFSLEEADQDIRKNIGKKKPEELFKVEGKFIEGCKRIGKISEKRAKEIFGFLKNAARYSFNKSHATSYGFLSYYTAYFKANYPIEFFCSYLKNADEKAKPQEEIKALIRDAKYFDIDIAVPELDNLQKNFNIKDDTIYFGITNIKGIAEKQADKLLDTIESKNWFSFLINTGFSNNKKVIQNLINAGVCDKFNITRQRMIFEFQTFLKLTKKEKQWIVDNSQEFVSLKDSMYGLLISDTVNKRRKQTVQDIYNILCNPPYGSQDAIDLVIKNETKLLGVPITYHEVEKYDIGMRNCTCKEFLLGKEGNLTFLVQIISVHEYTIKRGKSKGQSMAFVSFEDETGYLEEVVVFPDVWDKTKYSLLEEQVFILKGFKTKTGSFSIQSLSIPQSI